jgi:hypothetical protein
VVPVVRAAQPVGGGLGSLVVADPVNALLAAPMVSLFGLGWSYGIIVLGHLVFSGWAAHRLAEQLLPEGAGRAAAWVAGLGYLAAPVTISGIHNGTSEAVSAGWLPLALWAALAALRTGAWSRVAVAGLAVGVALWSSWYLGACAIMGVLSLAVVGEGSQPLRQRFLRLGPALGAGLLLAAPLAWWQGRASTIAGNLVGIKGEPELALVRRMTGAADPLSFFVPGDYRSPDFAGISRYAEDFVHCPYLGWILLAAAGVVALSSRDRRRGAWLLVAAALGAVLALGPVLVHDGHALLLPGDRAVPLPYLLIEWLPGASGMSLLFRLAMLPALCLALLAALCCAGRGRKPALLAVVMAALVFAELRFVSPVRGLPHCSSASASAPITALADAPHGAVMNFPVVGGRRYLYEQTIHGKPLVGSLNFPNSPTSRRIWKAILEQADAGPAAVRQALDRTACAEGVHYLVVHRDLAAMPDMHDEAVRALREVAPVLAEGDAVIVRRLCPETASADAAPRGGAVR